MPKHLPIKTAIATFVSFVIVGSIPLIAYVISAILKIWQGNEFFISIIFTSCAFIFVGQIRGKITKTNRINAAIETLVIGSIAAVVAYFVGAFLQNIVV